jgi:hypothetical protein
MYMFIPTHMFILFLSMYHISTYMSILFLVILWVESSNSYFLVSPNTYYVIVNYNKPLFFHFKYYMAFSNVLIFLPTLLFPPTCLLNFQKNSILHIYSNLHDYQIMQTFPSYMFIPTYTYIRNSRVFDWT